jgi:hypothetical protein
MDKISNISNIVNILREQIGKSTTTKSSSTNNRAPASATSTAHAVGRVPLAQLLSDRLKKLRKSDSDYKDKARQVLVETILIWEFGDTIINDPAYGELLNRIVAACNTEAGISGKLDTLLASENQ